MANTIDVTDTNFDETINNNELVVVDFWAPWCGPCRKLGPVLDDIAHEYSEKLKVVKLNTDENAESAKKHSVSGLPTLLLFKNGESVERMVGMLSKATIVSNIEKHLN